MVNFRSLQEEVQKPFSILMDWVVNIRGHSCGKSFGRTVPVPWSSFMEEGGARKPKDGELLGPHNDMESTDSREGHRGPDILHREILEPAGSEKIHFTKIK